MWMWVLGLAVLASGWGADPAGAATGREIDVSVDVMLEKFEQEVGGAKQFLADAKGVLVFPKVIKAGFGIGGEYGQGALRIGGQTVAYYNTIAGSFGFQVGAQARTVMVVFLNAEKLKQFRESMGFQVGVDGSVAVIALGAGSSIDSRKINDPIVGFIFDQKGLMVNLTLEGAKFTKLNLAVENTVKATAAWEGQGFAFPVGNDQAYMVGVYAGVMFVDDGKGPLNAAAIVCPGTTEGILTKGTKTGEGRCIITDQDGDRVFARFTCVGDFEGCRGPFTIVDGTGKFAGITGEGEMISRIQARQLTTYPTVVETVQQQGYGVAVWPALHYTISTKSN
jgi:lipid-binding SYLF domain-containing protein